LIGSAHAHKHIVFSLFTLLLFHFSDSQCRRTVDRYARYDLLNIAADSATVQTSVVTRPEVPEMHLKSPLAAAGMSLVIPGADRHIPAAIGSRHHGLRGDCGDHVCGRLTKKGDNKTTEFQNYADEHWSAVRYASGSKLTVRIIVLDAAAIASAITINPDVSLPPWQRVNFAQINAWKRKQKPKDSPPAACPTENNSTMS